MRGKKKKPQNNNIKNGSESPKSKNDICKGCQNKESHINWLCCDVCKSWWHCVCARIRVADSNIMKTRKIKYTCAYCVIEKLNPQTVTDQQFNSDSQLNEKTKPEETEPSKINRKSSVDLGTHKEIDIEKGTDSKPSDTESHSRENCTGGILIIDGIKNPKIFSDSSTIKKELKLHKNLNIKFTYQLSRGGIVVHTEKKEEIDILQDSWPPEAFGDSGESLEVHSLKSKYKCVLKNIPIIVSEAEISDQINTVTRNTVHIRRLMYKDSGKPLKIVVVECESIEDLESVQKSKFRFRNCTAIFSNFQSKRQIPTRCFKCQKFSHIAKLCNNNVICENCGKEHIGLCTNETCCTNCQGNHKASYRFCPVYMLLLEKLSQRE